MISIVQDPPAAIAPPPSFMLVDVPETSPAPDASVSVLPHPLDIVFTHLICAGLLGNVSLMATLEIAAPELFLILMLITLFAVPPESVTGPVKDFVMVG